MNRMTIAGLAALAALAATPVLAQGQAPAAAQASANAQPSGALSVETTPIGELIKNEKAKAVLEKALPEITQYYDQIGGMTLAQVAPMSQGALDDAKLKALQAEFDELK